MNKQQGLVGILVLLILAALVAGGAYYLGKVSNKSEIIETQKATQTTPGPTVDWDIYISKEHGFELRYPSDWRSVPWSEGIIVFNPEDLPSTPAGGRPQGVWVYVKQDADGLTPTEYVNQKIIPNDPYATNAKTKALDLSGVAGVQVEGLSGAGIPGPSVFITKNNLAVEIQAEALSTPEELHIFNQVVSTFRFTN